MISNWLSSASRKTYRVFKARAHDIRNFAQKECKVLKIRCFLTFLLVWILLLSTFGLGIEVLAWVDRQSSIICSVFVSSMGESRWTHRIAQESFMCFANFAKVVNLLDYVSKGILSIVLTPHKLLLVPSPAIGEIFECSCRDKLPFTPLSLLRIFNAARVKLSALLQPTDGYSVSYTTRSGCIPCTLYSPFVDLQMNLKQLIKVDWGHDAMDTKQWSNRQRTAARR